MEVGAVITGAPCLTLGSPQKPGIEEEGAAEWSQWALQALCRVLASTALSFPAFSLLPTPTPGPGLCPLKTPLADNE